MSSLEAPVRVGLAGAGPWARLFHAPLLAGGDRTELAGVWARRPEAARSLAEDFGTRFFNSFEELLEVSDMLAIAVAPDVQPELALTAAAAGRPLLLEKPLAANLDDATTLVETLDELGVPSLVMLTSRFAPAVNSFLASVDSGSTFGGRVVDVSDALLSGPFSASPWRHRDGALADIGPHAIDIALAAFGPVAETAASRSERGGFVMLQLEHLGGAVSTVELSLEVPGPEQFVLDVYGPDGLRRCDLHDLTRRAQESGELAIRITSALGDLTRGERSAYPDARRALEGQTIIDRARQLVERAAQRRSGSKRSVS